MVEQLLRDQHRKGEAGHAAREALAALWHDEPSTLLDVVRSDGDPTLRGLAADALGRLGDARAVEALTHAAQHAPADAAGHAADALAQIARRQAELIPQVAATLTALMADDRDQWLRVAAVEAAAELAAEHALAAGLLVEGMLVSLMVVEVQAAYTLTLEAVVGIGEHAVRPLAQVMDDRDQSDPLHDRAEYALSKLAEQRPDLGEYIHNIMSTK